MLYTINKSPLMFGNLKSVLRVAPVGEPLLLYEDGVYAAVNKDAVLAYADNSAIIEGTRAGRFFPDAIEGLPADRCLSIRGCDRSPGKRWSTCTLGTWRYRSAA